MKKISLTAEQRKEILRAKIRLLEAAYEEFHWRLEELKKEQDKLINQAVEEIDQQKIKNILHKIKKT